MLSRSTNLCEVRIVIAPDSFTGTLTAAQAALAIKTGWEKTTKADFFLAPMSDGGPGFIDAIEFGFGGNKSHHQITGLEGTTITAPILVVGKTAYIESHLIVGPQFITKQPRTPDKYTCKGIGELINIAVQQGCQTIFVGVGGTASIDGGAGILETVEKEKLGDVELVAATDVDVLLLGNRGAAKGFGEQKGASKELIEELEKKHEQLAQNTPKRKDNKDASQMLGAGAGGGIGFALMALGANRVSGLELVTESFDLANEITNSDLVITGEGKLDWQTLRGKVITGVAEIANESAISCLALCGQVIAGKRELAAAGIVGAYGCIEEGEELPADPFMALVFLAERVSRTWSQ
jgi:glycerate 2-kinase